MKKKTTSVTNPKLAHLLDLMKHNPHLPIIPMVNQEVVSVSEDSWAYWLGSWGSASVDRYYSGEERIYFYDERDMEDLLVEVKGWDWLDTSSEEEDLKVYRELPWKKAIFVYIETPEV